MRALADRQAAAVRAIQAVMRAIWSGSSSAGACPQPRINKPSAGGNLATEAAAAAKPDG